MPNQRIEYIDMMRGFTMILVVFSHICHFCLGDSRLGFNGVFILFRLPCFFFISGWLFEPVALRPFKTVIRHKAMVQLLPTLIFLLLLAPPPVFFNQIGSLKGGYWFTFVLFEYFVIYMFSVRLGQRTSFCMAIVLTIAVFCLDSYYHQLQTGAISMFPESFHLPTGVQPFAVKLLGFLSVPLWRFYIFFFIGAWVRQHFDTFCRITGRRWALPLMVLLFSLIATTPHVDSIVYEFLRFTLGGIIGMWMVFTIFRLSASWLQKSCLSQPLQYIGTRTLDIYMLHFFLLPHFLLPYADCLRAFNSSLMEFAVILFISFIVVALCLLASYVIRLSPFLGHYLFGVKYK